MQAQSMSIHRRSQSESWGSIETILSPSPSGSKNERFYFRFPVFFALPFLVIIFFFFAEDFFAGFLAFFPPF